MGLPNSMNDTWILHVSSLYKKVVIGYLFCFNRGKKVSPQGIVAQKFFFPISPSIKNIVVL